METFTIDGTFFESLKKGTILFVDRKDFEQAKRYRSAWVDCREVNDGLMSDLRSWAMDDLVEAVLPRPKLEVRVRYDEDLIQGERGVKFGACAYYNCQRPLAGWYNNATGRYVCARCAAEKNAERLGQEYAQEHGHPKYTPGGPARP
jgi:hypothetical protein